MLFFFLIISVPRFFIFEQIGIVPFLSDYFEEYVITVGFDLIIWRLCAVVVFLVGIVI